MMQKPGLTAEQAAENICEISKRINAAMPTAIEALTNLALSMKRFKLPPLKIKHDR